MKINKAICIFSLLIIFFLLSNNNVFAQKKEKKKSFLQGSELRFEFKGITDSLLYLASYYNGKTHIYDTLYPSPKERYTFVLKTDTLIPRGFYALASQNMVKYLDFVVDSSFSFTIAFDDSKMSNLRFIGSPENEIMLDFMNKMSYFQWNMMDVDRNIKNEQKSDNPNMSLIENQKEGLQKYRDSMLSFEKDFVHLHRNSLFAKARLIVREIELPDPPVNPDGSLVDSNFAFHYYLNHYWDNTDLQEPALLNTPSPFSTKLEYYFDHVVPPFVDSIIKYTDILLEKAKGNTIIFRYILSHLTSKSERSQYVAHDVVFVHLVLNYYARKCCPWVDEAVLERMVHKAEQLEPILIGKKAPELYMYDPNGVFRSNYESKRKYTVMWFWDLNCGICKAGTAKLLELYERAHDSLDFEVYAIGATNDIDKWKVQLAEKGITSWINVAGNVATIDYRKAYDINSFPLLLVLDKDKKIIVKKIAVDELENFLRNYDAGKIRY